MKDFDIEENEVVELGQASTETKGDAEFQIDVSGGQLRYPTGIAND